LFVLNSPMVFSYRGVSLPCPTQGKDSLNNSVT
jgi:hypothetical protein